MSLMGITVPLRREKCRSCGARGLHDSTEKCRQSQDQSGEYYCPGDAPCEEDTDEQGFFRYPTKAGERIINRWIDDMVDDARARGEI